MIRKVLFWTHLAAGLAAGGVILMMSATGAVLTYEAQWIRWAESRMAVAPRDDEFLDLDEIRARANEAGGARFESFTPISVTLRPGAGAPVRVSGGRSDRVYLDPYDGRLLGTGFPRLEGFLESVRGWHRWFNLEGAGRRRGRAWTGAANLIFLFMLCSGPFLWIPRTRTWTHFKQVLFFRRGLSPKARDFNWHNVLGIWLALPLMVIAASASVTSYAWAGDIVAWAAGEEPGARPPDMGSTATIGAGFTGADSPVASLRDAVVAAADRSVGDRVLPWREIDVTLPSVGDSTVSALVRRGGPGQPQLQEALTVDVRTGQLLERVGFENQPRARRYRSLLRFVHTGEYWGPRGQTVAGLVSLAAVLLGLTGISLALRRFVGFLRRRRTRREQAPGASGQGPS
ncbi:MAG: PepSY domain-containing protein [Gemmatimonadetes bacterium]|nr:PepSY domain-containing protein [Gemmatimonadota bacterium]